MTNKILKSSIRILTFHVFNMIPQKEPSSYSRNKIREGSSIPDTIQPPKAGEQQHRWYQEQDLAA